jgi:PAS domain S-box-containing protein/putative nucleotidyltransferase with HDIG domain
MDKLLCEEILDHLAEHVVVQDANHRVLWMNRAAARSAGQPRDALLGRTCFSIWPSHTAPCPDCPVVEARRTGIACQREMQTPDGRTWLITGLPIAGGYADEAQVIEVTLDITELSDSRRELAHHAEDLDSLFRNSRDPVYITTRSGRFLAVNQAMVDLFGYSRNALMGMTAGELYGDPDDRARFQAAVDHDGSVKDFSVTLVASDGRSLDCLLTSNARRQGREVVGYHGIIRDVTQDRRLARSIQSALHGTIAALGQTMEMRDSYTAQHQRRMTRLAVRIAERLRLSNEQVECIRVAGLMHDIGKLSIPAEILAKPARLSPAELGLIQQHPRTAYEILSPIEFPWPVAPIILQHHERLDGSGYPAGLDRGAIAPEARILAVADVTEAMATHRPYRPALGVAEALREIRAGRRTQFDGDVVDACVELFDSGAFAFEAMY